MGNVNYEKLVIPSILVLLIVLSALIIQPFLIPLFGSVILAYAFYPLYKWTTKVLRGRKNLSAAIVSVFILSIVIIPIITVINTISVEAYAFYIHSQKFLVAGDLLQGCSSSLCQSVQEWVGNYQVQDYIQKVVEGGATYLINSATTFVTSIPKIILNLFVTFFVMFYILRDSDKIINGLEKFLETKTGLGKNVHIRERFNDVMYATIFGAIFIAAVQGILGGIGFAVVGISSPLVWTFLMFMFALIPYLGTGIVWAPAALILISSGLVQDQTDLLWKGVGLLLYGALIVGTIDNILRPKVIGDRGKVHPAVVLIGILGGLGLWGLPGLVVGPVVLAMAITLIQLYILPNQE